VRIFNTYGPRMRADDGRVVTNFISQALAGQALTLYGDGGQTRSFCYVDDLVEGFLKVMDEDGVAGEVFNLGNEKEHSVRELSELVNQLTGNNAGSKNVPLPHEDDPTRRCPDAGKALAQFGWQASIPLVEGLTRTIEWFRGTA
jgi:nucleoside-diphosphate-sugar epimerase